MWLRDATFRIQGQPVLWALAADGTAWDALRADDHLLAAAVKGYVRHDVSELTRYTVIRRSQYRW